MNITDSNSHSKKWSSFRLIWWIVTFSLVSALFLLWASGYGPSGKSHEGKKAESLSSTSSIDSTAPVISLVGNSTVSIVEGESFTDESAKAEDDVDGALEIVTTGTVDINTPGEYTIIYSVTDAAGNSSSEARTVVVNPLLDTETPEIILVGEEVVNIKINSLYVDDGAIATDIPDGEIEVVTEGQVNATKVGEYLMTYSATDKAGNTTTKSRKVIVSEADNDAPVITMNGEPEIKLTIGDSYTDAGAKAVDISGGTLDMTVTGEVDTTTAGEYIINYSVTDIAGNKAEKVRTVIVSEPDSLPPVITLKGDQTITLALGDEYVDLGASAEDSIDGVVEISTSGKVRSDVAGEYTLIYSAKDRSGNISEEKRLVVVEALDKEGPVITLNGDSPLALNFGEDYVELGAKAEDVVDGEVDVVISGEVLKDTLGDYTLTYTAVDKLGNSSEAKRTVSVKEEDKTAPVITLQGESIINLKVGDSYEDAGATAQDDIDGEILVTTESEVKTNVAGQYVVEYSVADKSGNTAKAIRSVIVEEVDVMAPVITLNGEQSISLKSNQPYEELGAEALDAFDGKVEVTISGEVDNKNEGTYELFYSAIDKAGNKSTEMRKVIIESKSEETNVNEPTSETIFALPLDIDSLEEIEEISKSLGPSIEINSSEETGPVKNAKLYFDFNKSNNPLSRDGSFSKVIAYLKENDSSKANIYGFHDPSGDRNYNIGLANSRAESVSYIMMAAGIQSTRLVIKKPVETVGTGPQSEARRVEIDITE